MVSVVVVVGVVVTRGWSGAGVVVLLFFLFSFFFTEFFCDELACDFHFFYISSIRSFA